MSRTASRSPSAVERIVAGRAEVRFEDQDAVVLVADAELADRADHAVGDVAVRLAGRDREAARQDRTGKRDDHEVVRGEVVRAADDPARLVLADVDLAPADRLAVLLRLVVEGQHAADDDRSRQRVGARLDPLDLEADADQRVGQRAVAQAGWQVDVLGQPADRGLHAVPPLCPRPLMRPPRTRS